ncbi:hypothetical protein Tco_0930783 [Tanacetum coccineum]
MIENEIDRIQSSGGNQNTNKLLKESHDKIRKVFIMGSFIMGLNVNIVAQNHFVHGMLFNLIKNLYVPFGIPFDTKRYYNDGDCARMLRRPSVSNLDMVPLPPRDQRHIWLRYQVEGYTEEIVHDFEQRLEMIFGRAPLVQEFLLEFFSTCRIGDEMGLDVTGTLCFQLGGARRSMIWRQFILALGLYTAEEMVEDGFRAYWLASERLVPDKGDLILVQEHTEKRRVVQVKLGGHFIGRLAHHFGLVSDDGLRGLSVMARELSLIDIGELVKLNICMEIGH